jgi:homocysteine S-methyltransferase
MRLLDKLAQPRAVVLDGGLATTLESYGCDLNTSLWSSEVLRTEVEKIEQAHQDFTHAGADIVLTSTYQASFPTFKKDWLSLDQRDFVSYMIMLSIVLKMRHMTIKL